MDPQDPSLDLLLRGQAGVVARSQLLAAGLDRTRLAREVRRSRLVEVHRGVYVDHTGEPTWVQRAWAAVLWAAPAALHGASALRAFEGPGRRGRDESVVEVLVERDRRLRAPEGVRVVRRAGFDAQVQWNLGPPRQRYDQAALDVALAAGRDLDAVAALADAVGSQRTTALRMRTALADRPWVRRRWWLEQVLTDVAQGTCSVLEREHLQRVERAHALPTGERQVLARHAGRVCWRDVRYAAQSVVVELDGRLHHSSTLDRDRDLDRDLAAAGDGDLTLRLGWGQVVERPCETARRLADVLRSRGWTGTLEACGKCGAPDQPG